MWRQLGLPSFDVNVIVIDQFEELFTQSIPQPRDTLIKMLVNLERFTCSRTHFIATLRADYLTEMVSLPALNEIAKPGITLYAMGPDELGEAVQQPLRATFPQGEKRFEPALVGRLAHDCR